MTISDLIAMLSQLPVDLPVRMEAMDPTTDTMHHLPVTGVSVCEGGYLIFDAD